MLAAAALPKSLQRFQSDKHRVSIRKGKYWLGFGLKNEIPVTCVENIKPKLCKGNFPLQNRHPDQDPSSIHSSIRPRPSTPPRLHRNKSLNFFHVSASLSIFPLCLSLALPRPRPPSSLPRRFQSPLMVATFFPLFPSREPDRIQGPGRDSTLSSYSTLGSNYGVTGHGPSRRSSPPLGVK